MHTQNQCSRFRCRLYSTAPLICSRSTRSRPPVVLFGPLHTFTNDSKCHLPPNAPAPDAPAHLRARTHTHARTRVRTHPRPGSSQEVDSGQASRHGLRQVGGAGCRGPTSAVTGTPSPASSAQTPRRRWASPNRGGLGGSHCAGKRPRAAPRGGPRRPGLETGAGEEEGEDLLFDFLRRNSSRSAGSEPGRGALPSVQPLPALPGAGAFLARGRALGRGRPAPAQSRRPRPAPAGTAGAAPRRPARRPQVAAGSAPQPQRPLREPRADSRAPRDAAAAPRALPPGTPAPAPRTLAAAEPPLGIPTVTAPLARLGVSPLSASQ